MIKVFIDGSYRTFKSSTTKRWNWCIEGSFFVVEKEEHSSINGWHVTGRIIIPAGAIGHVQTGSCVE